MFTLVKGHILDITPTPGCLWLNDPGIFSPMPGVISAIDNSPRRVRTITNTTHHIHFIIRTIFSVVFRHYGLDPLCPAGVQCQSACETPAGINPVFSSNDHRINSRLEYHNATYISCLSLLSLQIVNNTLYISCFSVFYYCLQYHTVIHVYISCVSVLL